MSYLTSSAKGKKKNDLTKDFRLKFVKTFEKVVHGFCVKTNFTTLKGRNIIILCRPIGAMIKLAIKSKNKVAFEL